MPIPVPASASSMFGSPAARRGAKIPALPPAIARWPSRGSAPAPVSSASLRLGIGRRDRNGSRLRPLGPSSHCGRRENSIRSPRSGLRQPRRPIKRRPAPAEPMQRGICGPRAFALRPVGIAQPAEQCLGDRTQRRRRLRLAFRRLESAAPGPAPPRSARRSAPDGRRRTARAGRARHIGIAEPLPDQRRVQQDMRRFGRPGDRFAPRLASRTSPVVGDPDAGMGCMEGGKGQRSGHRAITSMTSPERKGNS